MIQTREIALTKNRLLYIYLKRLIYTRWWSFLLIWGVTVLLFLFDSDDELRFYLLFFSIFYPAIVIFNFYRYVNAVDNKIFYLTRVYHLYTDKIVSVLSNNTTSEISTGNIVNIVKMDNYFLAYISKTQFLYFPKESLDEEALVYLSNLNVPDKDKNILTFGKVFFGLLCVFSLIPFLGLLFALILLIFTVISRNKVKIAVVFLIFSALSSVGSYFYIDRVSKKINQSGFQEQMAVYSQDNLNHLYTSIEKFKASKKAYPDSLENVLEVDSMAIIKDFSYRIKGFQFPEYPNFYYLKIDSISYFLSAIGKDGIPNTKDDILPEISQDSIRKTGLKRFNIRINNNN